MAITTIPEFLLASLLIELTPGPNMAYLALVSATEGRRLGLATTAGVALGLLVIGGAAALGMSAFVAASPWAFQALRWAGVLYLLWLAWEAWRDEREASTRQVALAQSAVPYFWRGFITNLLNPKAGLFYLAVLPGFVDPMRAMLPQTAVLTLLYVGVATAIHLAIVGMAGTAHRWLDNPAGRRHSRRTFAIMLVAVAIWFVLRTA